MALSLLQIAATVVLITYVVLWFRQQTRRRKRSWHQIVAQLHGNDWGIEEIAENYLYKGGIRATEEDIWPRIAGCHGLWSMYKNAAVFIQLADYAAEHGEGVDPQMLVNLRGDAFRIRLYVLLALAQHAGSASSARASQNAHHAAEAYCTMLASLTELMQNSGRLFPSYLDAVA